MSDVPRVVPRGSECSQPQHLAVRIVPPKQIPGTVSCHPFRLGMVDEIGNFVDPPEAEPWHRLHRVPLPVIGGEEVIAVEQVDRLVAQLFEDQATRLDACRKDAVCHWRSATLRAAIGRPQYGAVATARRSNPPDGLALYNGSPGPFPVRLLSRPTN